MSRKRWPDRLAPLALAVWVPLAPLQVARQEVGVAAAAGRVYVFGGIREDGGLDSVEQYDPATARWRFVAPMLQAFHHAAVASTGDAIYVIGGYPGAAFFPTSGVFRYDVAGDFWTTVADLPRPRGAAAAAAIDGKIYVAGGQPTLTELLVYDPATDQWRQLAPMPTPREHLAAAAFDGKLYVVGGRALGNTGAFESYDPASNSWESLPPLPTPRSGLAAAVAGDRLYVFGGEGNSASSTGVFPQNEAYDFASRTWVAAPLMPAPRHGIGAAFVDGRIVIPGGATLQGFGSTSIADAFAPSDDDAAPQPRRRSVRH